jgi:MFS family permease
MLKKKFLGENGITAKNALISIVLIGNTLAWYSSVFNFMNATIKEINLVYPETLILWSFNFLGAAISALAGTLIIKKLGQRWVPFISFWMLLGIVSSLIPFVYSDMAALLITSLLFGISFGLGMPVCLKFYTECTVTETRGRFSGIIFFLSVLGILSITAIENVNIVPNVLILSIWRAMGLVAFLSFKPPEKLGSQSRDTSFISILENRHFLFYFVPWLMFSLVNCLSLPLQLANFDENSLRFLGLLESVLISCFALVGGFLSDFFGRKRMIIAGFIMLGMGYAILGMYPKELSAWYIYTIADGIAWGIFWALFVLTLWGDLSYGNASDKYYAIGGQPFLISNFLRFILAPYIAGAVPDYAIFSFAAFFLFLAVLPLMYAPETLPEKTIRERELKQYIDKAQKAKEKYA